MKSYALTLQLVDDPAVIAEYERQHQAVWPGVLARLREVGITRMQIFRNATPCSCTSTRPTHSIPARLPSRER